jgi:hypothetical protein
VGGAFVRYTDSGRSDYFRIGTSSTELIPASNSGAAPANSAYSGKTLQLAVHYVAAG